MARPDIDDALIAKGWLTPDTYARHYASLPASSAIYALVVTPDLFCLEPGIIGYVGKSVNVRQRLAAHEMITLIRTSQPAAHIRRWFMPVPELDLSAAEVAAIQKFNPPYNIQHRNRGIHVAS